MSRNIYDDEHFYSKYSQMSRSVGGLPEAGEWPTFRDLLPAVNGMAVLDLGCGFGWHCRYARAQMARHVVGVDVSRKMLEHAMELTDDPQIEYRLSSIEELDLGSERYDLVMSSLAFHYLELLDPVFQLVYDCLRPGGYFVFSVEHPIFTSVASQDWCHSDNGERKHWPVDNYQQEGARHTRWMKEDVLKYHRSLSTYVNAVLQTGFLLTGLREPAPSQELLARHPDWIDEARRPMFLIIAARREPELD